MKKNKMMRLASVLLVLTLLSTSVISGTFAKYVTEGSAGDSARVAKWGIVVDASGSLFGEDYVKYTTGDTNSDKISASVSESVRSSGAVNSISNIVAPGTKSDKGLTFGVTGTPEVAYTIEKKDVSIKSIWLNQGTYGVLVKTSSVTADNYVGYYYYDDAASVYKPATTEAWDSVSSEQWYVLRDRATAVANEPGITRYEPIYWTVMDNATPGSSPMGIGNKVQDVESYFLGGIVTSAGKPNIKINTSYTLSWEWPFEQQDENGDLCNGADTILGNLMAAGEDYVVVKTSDAYATCTKLVDQTDYNLEVAIDATFVVTQVD